jgi:acetyltransferase-like isoleucine patch superfamily enzyme
MTTTIDSSASISESAKLVDNNEHPISIGKNVYIGDHVKIYSGVSIGDDCKIEDNTIIGHPTKAMIEGADHRAQKMLDEADPLRAVKTSIADGAIIRSHAVIYASVNIGTNFRSGHHIVIREHSNIGINVVFGSFASCDGHTTIGQNTHIGQYVMLAHGAQIGEGCFIGGHTVFATNKYMVPELDEDCDSATIGNFVRIGLGCTIGPNVVVGDSAIIGMGSVVAGDLPSRCVAYGSPAQVKRRLRETEIDKLRCH